jgi:hypothetical protein
MNELHEKGEAELAEIKTNGERTVQQFGTILVGDARLRTIVWNLDEEMKVEAI